jgi:hypothetical protein
MSENSEMPGQRHKAGRTAGVTAPADPVRGLFYGTDPVPCQNYSSVLSCRLASVQAKDPVTRFSEGG